ncbi:amine oxidase [Candidatus Parcubacteria bacterium]|nr:MAG: amine oxidase [Candidatus Parcubacteria bacterium]
MKSDKKIVIIGGGPTGIGAAYRLNSIGYKNWCLYEKENQYGGLSATIEDEYGFLWDFGGHVSFSHYDYYDKYVEEVLKDDVYKHDRESWVRYIDAWVPYPFQNNLRYLNKEDQLKCINGLLDLEKSNCESFEDWIYGVFGEGIAEKFMIPYNFKVWATPANLMSDNWIKERVSVIDIKRAIKNIILETDDLGWGPNNKFSFPKYGGTGEIFNKGMKRIGKNQHKNKTLKRIEVNKKLVYFSDGSSDNYNKLISTIPLDSLVKMIDDVPKKILEKSEELVHNSVYVIGIGIKKKIETSKCWVYFPEKDTPFYRLTFFHNYSNNNVPGGDTEQYSSLMLEVSYSEYKQVDKSKVIDDCIEALARNKIIGESDKDKIVSRQIYDLPYAYPVPTLKREGALGKIQKYLMDNDIYSRGRFGGWKYEVGNMDHSFMQGVESVERILKNKDESIYNY